MKKVLFLALTLVWATSIRAAGSDTPYMRNSLGSMLLVHEEDEFHPDIETAYLKIATPNKFNEHNVNTRLLYNSQMQVSGRRQTGLYKSEYGKSLMSSEIQANAAAILRALEKDETAKKMVAKWFSLEGKTVNDAHFGVELIQERGEYAASDLDVRIAMHTLKGRSTLQDAGEQLIDHTFLIVNDITYVTAEQRAAAAKAAMSVLGALFNARDIANAASTIADAFTGFTVRTHSYLYQLEWNDSVAAIFYDQYYTETPDPAKITAFLSDKTTFHLKYVAHEYEFAGKSELVGVTSRNDIIQTQAARSIDRNIAALQRAYYPFRVRVPIFRIITDLKGKSYYAVRIGQKEGLTPKSKFQVLLQQRDPETNKTVYKKVAIIKPANKYIWDDRFNLYDEQSASQDSTRQGLPAYTLFKKVSGSEIVPGMLIIQIK